jgi:ketosteroid isomerase-like protein
MAQDKAEIVRALFDAISRGDIDAVEESVTDDVEMDWSNSRSLLSSVHRGRDNAREALTSFLEPWESLTWDPKELIELDDDRVLAVSEIRMRGHGSGVDVSARGASIWTIRDGKAAAAKLYQSKGEALEAAGAADPS